MKKPVIAIIAAIVVIAAGVLIYRGFGPGDKPAGLDQALARGSLAKLAVHDTPKPLPDLPMTRLDGSPVGLDAYRGRVVLLNLWATWCAPCIEEMPALLRLQTSRGGPDFTVLAVAADQGGAAVVAPFLDRLQLTGLDVTIDKSMKTLGALQVAGLPTTLIIDRQGREVARLVGIAHWDEPEGVALIDAVAALGQPADND
ncbi:TlpA disulfide reductase family protein [Tistrella bauzanensis]|jgi:thiol-disulfide isomerase/thioredoxin|uniref:TlpA disulfide reductase family protein n=1 Tax=Tistrella arctica TaxID=3133430 RepID=A0ABU9YFX3_9PROT